MSAAATAMPTVIEISPQSIASQDDVRMVLLDGRLRKICIAQIVSGCIYAITCLGGVAGFFSHYPSYLLTMIIIFEAISTLMIILPGSLILCCKCCNCCCNSKCEVIGHLVLGIFGCFSIIVFTLDDLINAIENNLPNGMMTGLSVFISILGILVFCLLLAGVVTAGQIACECRPNGGRQMVISYQQMVTNTGSGSGGNTQVSTSPYPVACSATTSGADEDPGTPNGGGDEDAMTSHKDTQFLITS